MRCFPRHAEGPEFEPLDHQHFFPAPWHSFSLLLLNMCSWDVTIDSVKMKLKISYGSSKSYLKKY